MTVFNSHSTIQVGGKTSPLRGGIERPFQGIISGLVVNGDRILDMAAEDDPRISVRGDVELLMSLPLSLQQRSVPAEHQQMQQVSFYVSTFLLFLDKVQTKVKTKNVTSLLGFRNLSAFSFPLILIVKFIFPK